MIHLLILFVCWIRFQEYALGHADCPAKQCDPSGPEIRFPFRLIDRHDAHCGYPGFDLSCNPNNKATEIAFQLPVQATAGNTRFPLSANASVSKINYSAQKIWVNVQDVSCLPGQASGLVNTSPDQFLFNLDVTTSHGYTLFNCSGGLGNEYNYEPVKCLNHGGFQVFAVRSFSSLSDLSFSSLSDLSSLSSCVKMYDISGVSSTFLGRSSGDIFLQWTKPSCRACEVPRKKQCRLKDNGSNNEIECFDLNPKEKKKEWKEKVVTAITVVSSFLLSVGFGSLYRVYYKKQKKIRNQRKIVQFLDDYGNLKPTRYSYSDIKRMTEDFRHKLGRGGYGTVYKGMLSNEIPVAVKILNNIKGNGDDFVNEVATIGQIHHVNVVRLVGYCADGYRRALVYEYLENDSLEKYICLGDQGRTIGWPKLFETALGIAKGIDYLHQGCNQRILHFDIKPQNILLDQNLSPKVADFGLAKLCSKDKSVITMTAARGTIGYIAPEVFSRNFGRVSYKSDIYSFGMMMLDIVGGRKNFREHVQADTSQVYFPEWMYDQLEKGEDIAMHVESAAEIELVRRLIIVGLWCIQWHPIDRPSMKLVIQMLEGEDTPIMPPNPFADSKDDETDFNTATTGSYFSSNHTITSGISN